MKKVVKKKTKPFEFTVLRSKWYRGRGSDKSRLLNSAGEMCCLGFYVLACDIDKRAVLDKCVPDELDVRVFPKLHESIRPDALYPGGPYSDNGLVGNLLKVNDHTGIGEKEREKELTKLFRQGGIKVTFK